jgi:hypothetical protein
LTSHEGNDGDNRPAQLECEREKHHSVCASTVKYADEQRKNQGNEQRGWKPMPLGNLEG